ncbi:hypothetical protein A3F37_01790 [Candidatus Saccharibacteria bacterium RIFCSPHIGHO2_12_FULL_41_12]|nr:MAG: hypothetical protein A3F37_01790 [Candidatus Saccharibacteria bacterium RIFCSPHIGHO2_12_FULL_41_12]
MEEENKPEENISVDDLEAIETSEENVPEETPVQKPKRSFSLQKLIGKLNIYLLGFILLIIIAGVASFFAFYKAKVANPDSSVKSTALDQNTMDKLKETDVKVGSPKQTLSVESNAIFAGKVLIRDNLEVAGQIKVGGSLSLPGISVSGTSNFDHVQVNNLQIAGNTTIQGQLSVQKGMSVSGPLSVGGILTASSLNIQTLQINGDILLNRHIDAGGGTPSRSNGGALGSGGTSSISGTDTAGTVNVNIGGGPGAGCFATINFTQKFNSPHIAITPVGSAGGDINYYINKSSSNFSICTSSPAPAGSSFAFDYIVID